jgi:hypothetical protein
MRPEITRLIAKIQDAGRTTEAWPDALKSLTDVLGIAGAACIISNKRTMRAEWVCFSGLSAEFQYDYIDRYAPLDPYAPLLNVAHGWTKLSECLTDSFLRNNEWYNDFVLACGVRDILGRRLADTPSHSVVFNLHQQIGRHFGVKTELILEKITEPLGSAALQHLELLFEQSRGGTDVEGIADGARYYFHVGARYPDQTGKLFSTRQEAMAHAGVLAAELRQDTGWEDFAISVTDGDGREIMQMPVRS